MQALSLLRGSIHSEYFKAANIRSRKRCVAAWELLDPCSVRTLLWCSALVKWRSCWRMGPGEESSLVNINSFPALWVLWWTCQPYLLSTCVCACMDSHLCSDSSTPSLFPSLFTLSWHFCCFSGVSRHLNCVYFTLESIKLTFMKWDLSASKRLLLIAGYGMDFCSLPRCVVLCAVSVWWLSSHR